MPQWILNIKPFKCNHLSNRKLAIGDINRMTRVSNANPNLIEYNRILEEAKNALYNDKPKEALKILEGALLIVHKFDTNFYLLRGQANRALGDYGNAIEDFKKALELDNESVLAMKLLAVSYFEIAKLSRENNAPKKIIYNNYKRALDAINRLEKFECCDLKFMLRKAEVLAVLGMNKEAIQYFDKVLEDDPKNVEALIHKSIALVELGQTSEAILIINEALKLETENPELWVYMANVLNKLGRYSEAQTCLMHAKKLKKANP